MTTPPSFPQQLLSLVLAGAFLTISTQVAANDDDDEDREWRPPIEDLFKTELVFPQEQGELQLAIFPSYLDGPEGSAFLLPVGMEYGITDSLQFEVEWGAYINADADEADESGSGQGNLQLGLMYSLLDIRGSGLHFAAGAEYEFASGDSRFLEGGLREDSQELYLILAKDLAEDARSQLFLQIGVELQKGDHRHLSLSLTDGDDDLNEDDLDEGDDEDTQHDPNVWFANVGGYMTWDPIVLSLELNLSEEKEERYATPGISYQPMDNFEVGVGVAVGLTEEADDYQLIGKLLWEFGD